MKLFRKGKSNKNDLLVDNQGNIVPKYVITEGVLGNFHYHFSHVDKNHQSLCGRQTMLSGMKIDDWKKWNPTHIHVTYCSECDKLMKEGK